MELTTETERRLAVLARLEQVIESRRGGDPETSHTARMLAKGPEKCARKFAEEAVELVIAAVKEDRRAVASEAADAIYHLLLTLAARKVPLREVMAELEKREGASGVAEKAARTAEGVRSDK